MTKEVSVIVIAYNEQEHIKECLTAILNQSFAAFELIIVDDGSMDKTAFIVESADDERIRYIRNDKNCGVAQSRNNGLKYASGKYIFFTDADCVPVRYWLEEGLAILKTRECLGVKGKTFYDVAKPAISDKITDFRGYGTNNIAYTKEILNKVGGFDLKYRLGGEDIDLAFRVRKYGEIIFSEDMLVIHQMEKYTVRSLFRDIKREESTVYLVKNYKDYGNSAIIRWRILYPKKLLVLLCPLLLIYYYSFRSWQDIKLLPFVYFSAFYLRFIIWKTAIKEKFFLI
jgi:glycosyltransferase involved in cell wall biosynthesis